MYNSENLQEKWQVLNHPDLPEIKDNYKKLVTSIILENQEKAMKEDASSFQKGLHLLMVLVVHQWVDMTQF